MNTGNMLACSTILFSLSVLASQIVLRIADGDFTIITIGNMILVVGVFQFGMAIGYSYKEDEI